MAINFFAEDIKFPQIDRSVLKKWINNTIKSENMQSGEINIIFSSDSYLLGINERYLNKKDFTDIITFDYCEDRIVAGDLFISLTRVKENSEIFGTGYPNELNRVIIHGILHLLGYNDISEEEKKCMRQKENEYLNSLNSNS